MSPIMPFLSETLYCALPGKNKSQIAYTQFPEPDEVYLLNNIVFYVILPYTTKGKFLV